MILLVILLLLRVGVEATSQSSLHITSGSPNGTLLEAFRNSAVTNIYFKADYNIGDEFKDYSGAKPPLPINRSITLSGATGSERPQLDFNFQFGVLEICSNCTVRLERIALANERRGTGYAFDFFIGQPGSLLILNDTYRVRLSCTKVQDALALTHNTPRAPDYPGLPGEEDTQVALPYGVNVTYHGVQYLNSLDVVNMAVDITRTFQELRGLQGGFTMVILNTVRLCAHTVSNECLLVKSAEACVNEMIDNLLAPHTTTGGGHSNDLVALVAPLVVGAILAAAAVALIMYVLRRRWRRSAAANAAAAGGRSKGGVDGQDLEAGQTHGKGGDGTLFDDADASQHMHAKGWVVTHSRTAPLLDPVQDDRIKFGVLLGAGSFGKVYRGWWADKEVAIKVIEHNQSNVAAVENEVMLMLSFDHPNVVRAYHFVTFTMVNTPAGSDAHGTGTTVAGTSSNSIPNVAAVHTSSSSSSNRANAAAGSRSVAAAAGRVGGSRLASPGRFGSNVADLRRSPLSSQLQQREEVAAAAGGLAVAQPLDPHNEISAVPNPAVPQSPRTGSPRPGVLSRFASSQIQQPHGGTGLHDAGSATTSLPLLPHGVGYGHERLGRSGSSSSDARMTSLSDAIKDIHAGGGSHARQQQQQQQNAQERLGGMTPRRQHLQQQQQQQQHLATCVEGADGGLQQLQSPPRQRCRSDPGGSNGQQQQHIVSPEQAVRPGSPRPDSPRPGSPRPGSPMPSGSHPNANGDGCYVCPSTPLSELIDTSRWPGIIDYVSAQSAGQRDSARAKTWLVLEFCDLGTLGNIASDWSPDHEGDEQMMRRLILLHDAAKGLQALHSKDVVHGDLNARNVLVSSNSSAPIGMVAKLTDLGLSRVVKQHKTHRTTNTVGTMSHMPPELLRYGRMSAAVDLFAFGVMMWEVFTGQAAFRALHYGQFFEMVVLRNQRPPLPPGMPEDYQLLMEHCWSAEPRNRPNVDMLLECLSLMISDRQQNIISKQALFNQSRLEPPTPAAVPEDLLQQQHPQQQQRQFGMTSQASSLLPDSLGPAAGAVAAPGPPAMSSTSLRLPNAVHREGSSGPIPQSNAPGRDGVTPSGSSSSNTNHAGLPAAARAASNAMSVAKPTAHSIHKSQQRSPRKLHPRRPSEPVHVGVNRMSVTVAADLTSLDQPQQRQASQPLPPCELEGSHHIQSW